MFIPANTAHFTLVIPSVQHRFKVLAFEGSEAISSLYAIRIELVSQDASFDLENLLSRPAFLQFGPNGEGIHGRIEDVCVGGAGRRLTRYQLTLVPALHYLQFSHDHKIFQHMTVPEIIAQVLKGHGILSDGFTFQVTDSRKREYCTQYAESDFEFVQRLCSEEGIAWHHRHAAEGHHLVFTDLQGFLRTVCTLPYQQDNGMVAQHPVVSQFSLRLSTRTSKTTRRDYDPARPDLLREGQSISPFKPQLEDYRYPVPIVDEAAGKRYARQALERHRSDYQLAEGKSDQAMLHSGFCFRLSEHPYEHWNDLWLLLSVTHTGKQPQVLEETLFGEVEADADSAQTYSNSFSAIPQDAAYRPPLVTRRTALVSQTARVTGPAGQEIFCDEQGRVKVEFHWDRAGLRSDKSSCWLRVASGWAGDGFGAVTIPRIGMEVVVTYQEGDPDKPLITGCVRNRHTPAPYPLPEHKTRTVLRSKSSPANGGYNELSIEDRAGQELIYVRAQRDMEQRVEHDSRLHVGNERRETIKGNSISVLEAEDQRTVSADRKVDLKSSDYLQIADSSHTHVGRILTAEAGDQVHFKAGAAVVIHGGTSITLSVGAQHITINPGGIFSSTPIQPGGTPMVGAPAMLLTPTGIAPLSALPASIATPRSITAAIQQQGADYCPLCEACRDGLCNPGAQP